MAKVVNTVYKDVQPIESLTLELTGDEALIVMNELRADNGPRTSIRNALYAAGVGRVQ